MDKVFQLTQNISFTLGDALLELIYVRKKMKKKETKKNKKE